MTTRFATAGLPVEEMDFLYAGPYSWTIYHMPAEDYNKPVSAAVDAPNDVKVIYDWFNGDGDSLGGGAFWVNPGSSQIPLQPAFPGAPPCGKVLRIAFEQKYEGATLRVI
jgi:hypothetical protein